MPNTNTVSPETQVPVLRWQLPLVLLVSVLIAYFDWLNISYALPKIAQDYGWSVAEIGKYGGFLMSIFYVGYGLANIFLSPIEERFGARRSLIVIESCFPFSPYWTHRSD